MSESAGNQAAAMDRMYRLTRHVYDLTRAYYLLGRDRMLAMAATNPSTATLEVGCGTARNLIKLARRPEPGLLCGLDASQEMLDTAAARDEEGTSNGCCGQAGRTIRQFGYNLNAIILIDSMVCTCLARLPKFQIESRRRGCARPFR